VFTSDDRERATGNLTSDLANIEHKISNLKTIPEFNKLNSTAQTLLISPVLILRLTLRSIHFFNY